MIHSTPTNVLLATTRQPLGVPRSGSLAHGAKLLDQCLPHTPTPQKMATFAWELRTLWREGGRRMMAWVLHHMEPASATAMPSHLWWQGRA